MPDDTAVTGAAPHGIPEPAPAGSHVVQDNVTEPGVQRTTFPDGSEHVHYGDDRDNLADDEPADGEPADGVGDQDGDAAAADDDAGAAALVDDEGTKPDGE